MKNKFTIKLLDWHVHDNKRIMPWKGIKDPYKIWLSEIILQQTRVEQGLAYYNKFIHKYPRLTDLASARDEDVFKMWEGLGYYTRCKNLLKTARTIANENEGVFPAEYQELLKLPGIGPYTAAAIASFAFNLPFAVVDGNVFRVLSRFFGERRPVDNKDGVSFFSKLAQKLLDVQEPGTYNQAIMDFGATICKPQIPHCSHCYLKDDCKAFKKGTVNVLPVKEKQLLKRQRWLYYFIFSCKDIILVNKRNGKGIWENLYEFYLYEASKAKHWNSELIAEWMNEQLGITTFIQQNISGVYRQILTHQKIEGQFICIELQTIPQSLQHLTGIKRQSLNDLAFPQFIRQYLQQPAKGVTQMQLL